MYRIKTVSTHTMELLMAIDKYDLGNDLREVCIEDLKSNVTIHNAVEMLARSYQIGCKDLQMAAVKFAMDPKNHGKMFIMKFGMKCFYKH